MKLSIFTPTHSIKYLDIPYFSIKNQLSHENNFDVEWVIVPNNNIEIPEHIRIESWVKIYRCPGDLKNIGALKRFACEHATGDVFIELDHDDELLPGSLKVIYESMKNKENCFLYSDKTVKHYKKSEYIYSSFYGWEHYIWNGQKINKGFLPDARSLCEIFFAPDHVRAWSRRSYELSGGHAAELFVGDDHQLVIKTYLAGSEFIFVDRPLYNYNIHGQNSWLLNCAEVQKTQKENKEKYLRPLITEWCRRANLKNVHYPSDKFTIAEESSLGAINLGDELASVPAGYPVIDLINNCYNKLVPGGWLLVDVPSTEGKGAFCDPLHTSFWNDLSFRYYTDKNFSKFIPTYTGRFQEVLLQTHMPSEWHKTNNVPYVRCDMCAIKGQRQPGGKFI